MRRAIKSYATVWTMLSFVCMVFAVVWYGVNAAVGIHGGAVTSDTLSALYLAIFCAYGLVPRFPKSLVLRCVAVLPLVLASAWFCARADFSNLVSRPDFWIDATPYEGFALFGAIGAFGMAIGILSKGGENPLPLFRLRRNRTQPKDAPTLHSGGA